MKFPSENMVDTQEMNCASVKGGGRKEGVQRKWRLTPSGGKVSACVIK